MDHVSGFDCCSGRDCNPVPLDVYGLLMRYQGGTGTSGGERYRVIRLVTLAYRVVLIDHDPKRMRLPTLEGGGVIVELVTSSGRDVRARFVGERPVRVYPDRNPGRIGRAGVPHRHLQGVGVVTIAYQARRGSGYRQVWHWDEGGRL